MASKCFSCNEPILNSEFIKCEGICCQLFHSRCVSLNKTTLNAITSNANVHWFCHDCNDGSRNVSTAINGLKSSVDQLTNSLAVDLSSLAKGFKTLTENLLGSISNLTKSNAAPLQKHSNDIIRSNNKRGREESTDDTNANLPRQKKIILGTNEDDRSIAAAYNVNKDNITNDMKVVHERRKSVVVTNINSSITPEYLINYLTKILKIDKEKIKVTLLTTNNKKPNQRTFNSLQYRISTPESKYEDLMTPSTWPVNVRVRDYFFKQRNNEASMENFLEKDTTTRARDWKSQSSENPVLLNTQPNDITNTTTVDQTETSEMEQID